MVKELSILVVLLTVPILPMLIFPLPELLIFADVLLFVLLYILVIVLTTVAVPGETADASSLDALLLLRIILTFSGNTDRSKLGFFEILTVSSRSKSNASWSI